MYASDWLGPWLHEHAHGPWEVKLYNTKRSLANRLLGWLHHNL